MPPGTPRRRAAAAIGIVVLAAGGLVAAGSTPAGATTVSNETEFRSAWTNATETQIDLANDITLTCPGASTRASTTPVTLDGHGHTITQTCATVGVLVQNGTGAVHLQNVTITGGHASLSGGAINANNAPLTLIGSTITGNTANLQGGGLSTSGGAVTVTSSTITGNTAGTSSMGFGGGIRTLGGSVTVTGSTITGNSATGPSDIGGGIGTTSGAVTVTTSTVSGNTTPGTSGSGGGIGAISGPVTVTTSTLSGNSAALEGGAIRDNTGLVKVTNSTVSANTGGTGGGGIRNGSGAVALVYATVVENGGAIGANVHAAAVLTSFASVLASPQGGGTNCAGLTGTTSNGFNFSDDASCGLTASTDKQNGGSAGLGALADNGGPTQTRLPQPGSPLIDVIPFGSCQADGAAGITTDQRGVARPGGTGCEIGAVEIAAPTPVTVLSTQAVGVIPKFTG